MRAAALAALLLQACCATIAPAPSSAPLASPTSSSSVPVAAHRPSPAPHAVSHHLEGTASWYRWRPGEAAAGPALRAALGPRWRGQQVRVCAGVRCATVRLTDYCGCYGTRLVDLDAATFAQLAPLSRGLIRVEVVLQ